MIAEPSGAVAAAVLLSGMWVSPVLAIEFGLVALHHGHKDPAFSGQGMAIAAIVVGAAWLIWLGIVIGLFLISPPSD